jgi:iron complex outermembrane receptor protein
MRLSVSIATLAFSLVGLSIADESHAASKVAIHIPPQPLGAALQTLAKDRGFQVVYESAAINPVRTKGATGELTSEEALTQLLSGTGFTYQFYDDNAVSILPLNAQTPRQAPRASNTSESEQTPSNSLRVAQEETQAAPATDVSVEKSQNSAATSQTKPIQTEEVVVTGSRLPRTAQEGAQDVRTYTEEQIEQSGRTTIADFLNTLPAASLAVTTAGFQTSNGATTVQLHGLPLGTTLVLINGRRVEGSAANESTASIFDLNNIPLAAVERVEVMSEGSSAIYGSDAIAGVVNIILKSNFEGLQANAKYGAAAGTDDTNFNVGWGKSLDKGGVTLVGSYQVQSELEGFERSITASDDHTRYGGTDNRIYACNPGNVYSTTNANLPGTSSTYAAVPAGFTGTPTEQEFAATAGTLNRCNIFGYSSSIPAVERAGLLAAGHYEIAASLEAFTEMLFSRTQMQTGDPPPFLFGEPGYTDYTVAAANPYNPFGEVVGISAFIPSTGRLMEDQTTIYYRPLIGLRGNLLDSWHWEVAGWDSADRSRFSFGANNVAATQAALNSSNPATALNPFIDGLYGSPALLQSVVESGAIEYAGNILGTSGFIRGPIVNLSSGPVEIVLGGEYEKQKLYTNLINDAPYYPPDTRTTYREQNYSFFSELRVPVLANRTDPQAGDRLAITLAGRYDDYTEFGNKTTPQLGAEWRPTDAVLIRGSYSRAFKVPTLYELNEPQTVCSACVVTDPKNGNQQVVTNYTTGGNPKLRPETGQSKSVGFVYSSKAMANLRLAVTHWEIDESNSIQTLDPQVLVDNESLFPGNVLRNSAGVITNVNATYINFGRIDIKGFDYQLNYAVGTRLGQFSPSLAVTQTYRYTSQLTPGSAPVDDTSKANDDGNWAPRWKGNVGLGWSMGIYSASVVGRYVGSYRDYDPLPNGTYDTLGNFWLYDVNFRATIGQLLAPDSPFLRKAYLEMGGVNLFNTLPQYSTYFYGQPGYDATQADIRGRFLYTQVGVKW